MKRDLDWGCWRTFQDFSLEINPSVFFLSNYSVPSWLASGKYCSLFFGGRERGKEGNNHSQMYRVIEINWGGRSTDQDSFTEINPYVSSQNPSGHMATVQYCSRLLEVFGKRGREKQTDKGGGLKDSPGLLTPSVSLMNPHLVFQASPDQLTS